MPVYSKKGVFLKDPHSYATRCTSRQDPFPVMQIKLWLFLMDAPHLISDVKQNRLGSQEYKSSCRSTRQTQSS